jgi:hypothetical protein
LGSIPIARSNLRLVAADLGGRLLQPTVKRRNALWIGEVHVRDGNPDLRDGVGANAGDRR